MESILDVVRSLCTGFGVIVRRMAAEAQLVLVGDVFQLEGPAVRGGDREDAFVKHLGVLRERGGFTDSIGRRRRLAAAGAATREAGEAALGVSGPIRAESLRVSDEVAGLVNDLLRGSVIPQAWEAWYPRMTGTAKGHLPSVYVVPRSLDGGRNWAGHAPSDMPAAVAAVEFCAEWLGEHGGLRGTALVLSAYRSVTREAETYVADLVEEGARVVARGEPLARRLAAAARVHPTTFVACVGADVQIVAIITVGHAERYWGLRTRQLVVGITRGRYVALVANDEAGLAVVVPPGLLDMVRKGRARVAQGAARAVRAASQAVRSALLSCEALVEFAGSAFSAGARASGVNETAVVRDLAVRAAEQAEARSKQQPVVRGDAVVAALRTQYESVISGFVRAAGVEVERTGNVMRVPAQVDRSWGETKACHGAMWVAAGHVLPKGAVAEGWGGILTRGAGGVVGGQESVRATLYGRCGTRGRSGLAATVAFATACAMRWRTAAGKALAGKSNVRWYAGGHGAVEVDGEVFAPPVAEGVAAVVCMVPAVSPRPACEPKDEAHVRVRVDVCVGAAGGSGVHVVSVRVAALVAEDDPLPGAAFWARMGRALASAYPALREDGYRAA